MIVDASAIVAIILDEPDAAALWTTVLEAERVGVSAATLVEASMVLESRLGSIAGARIREWLEMADVEVLSFEDGHWQFAVAGWRRFGKGRHPAKLNFGDCLTYGTAKYYDQPVLCVGNDFPQTDLEMARYSSPVQNPT